MPESILVMQTAFIGDVVLVIPLLQAISKKWPASTLDVLVRPPADNLLETLPFISNVIVYDKLRRDRGISGFGKLRNRLRREGYSLAFLPHRSLRSGLLAYLAEIPIRIGFSRGGGRWLHSQRIRYPAQGHEIQRNLSLLAPFGSIPPAEPPLIIPTAEDVARVDRLTGDDPEKPLIVLAPGSTWYTKRWPEDYYCELGVRCVREGFRLILMGGLQDRELCGRLGDHLGHDYLDLAGKLSLRQAVEVLRRSALLITNDSAPTHLGTAAGTRVLTLFGSTSPDFGFAPFGAKGKVLEVNLYCRPCTDHGRQRCPEKHLRCLREITPKTVFRTAMQMINSVPV